MVNETMKINKLGCNDQYCSGGVEENDNHEIEDLSEEFIEIDCAVIDQITSDNVCKVCWSND